MAAHRITLADWHAAARERYGQASAGWWFRCPACRVAISVEDWREAGAPEGATAFSCIGRYQDGKPRDAFAAAGAGPCNYAGGGLFKLNPVVVIAPDGSENDVFDFADRPLCEAVEAA